MPRSAAIVRALTGVTPPDDRMARQHAFEHRAAKQLVVFGRQLAVVAHAHRADARLAHLRDDQSQRAAPASDKAAAACRLPRETEGKFTALRMMPSLRKSRNAAAVSVPTCSCASFVDAAMCGVATTCGSVARRQSFGGSGSNTSSPAPATCPLSMASASAALVNQLAARCIDDADALLAFREPFGVEEVPGGRQRRQDEARCSRRAGTDRPARRARRPRSPAISAEMNGSCAITFISKACARAATSCPMRPRPTRPRVFDRISAPANFDFSHFAGLHRRIGRRNIPCQRQDEAHRELGDAQAVGAGRVHDDDAARGGGWHVDVVNSRASARDDAQLGRRLDHFARHFRRASDDKRVGVLQDRRPVLRRTSLAVVDGPVRLLQTCRSRRREGRRR